jgi:hypothetical protein
MRPDEALGAFAGEHHVRAALIDGAGGTNGIADSADRGDGSGAKRTSVHDDGVAFDVAVEIEMRAIAGVEDRILFEDDDGGFDGVESGAARGENGPTGHQSAMAALFAGVHGFIGDIPGATVNDERRFHANENGKGEQDCPEGG